MGLALPGYLESYIHRQTDTQRNKQTNTQKYYNILAIHTYVRNIPFFIFLQHWVTVQKPSILHVDHLLQVLISWAFNVTKLAALKSTGSNNWHDFPYAWIVKHVKQYCCLAFKWSSLIWVAQCSTAYLKHFNNKHIKIWSQRLRLFGSIAGEECLTKDF